MLIQFWLKKLFLKNFYFKKEKWTNTFLNIKKMYDLFFSFIFLIKKYYFLKKNFQVSNKISFSYLKTIQIFFGFEYNLHKF